MKAGSEIRYLTSFESNFVASAAAADDWKDCKVVYTPRLLDDYCQEDPITDDDVFRYMSEYIADNVCDELGKTVATFRPEHLTVVLMLPDGQQRTVPFKLSIGFSAKRQIKIGGY